MKCKQCNNELKDGVTICPKCGYDNSDDPSSTLAHETTNGSDGMTILGGTPNDTDDQSNTMDSSTPSPSANDGSNHSDDDSSMPQAGDMIGAEAADEFKDKTAKALSSAGEALSSGGSKVFGSMKKGGASFIQLIKSPTGDHSVDIVSCLWMVLLEWIMMTVFFALIGTTLIKTMMTVNSLISVSSFGMMSVDLTMAWYVPIICGLILLLAHYIVFQLALFVGKRRFSLTTVIAHTLVPSLALGLCGLLTLVLSMFHLASVWVLIPLVLLWLSSTMIVVVDDLKISHYYIRIIVMTLIGCLLIATLMYAFYAVMDGIHINVSNYASPNSVNYGSIMDMMDGLFSQF